MISGLTVTCDAPHCTRVSPAWGLMHSAKEQDWMIVHVTRPHAYAPMGRVTRYDYCPDHHRDLFGGTR